MRVSAVLLSIAACTVGALGALAVPAGAALREAPPAFVPGGPVGGLAAGPLGLYVSGKFDAVGPYTGPGVQLDASTAAIRGSIQALDGAVYAVVADGAGGWYVGGSFQHAAGRALPGLAHVLADGSIDPAFDARLLPDGGTPARVTALALVGGRLYVGGRFSSIGGGSQSSLAAVDPATGNLITGFRPTLEGAGAPPNVYALAAGTDHVYAGGTFQTPDGSRSDLAAFDPATGAVMPAFDPSAGQPTPRPPDVGGPVESLLLAPGGRLLVGGRFGAVGGHARNNVAAVDATSGAVDPAFDPNADAEVDALALAGGRVLIGGGFDFVNGRRHRRLAAIDLATGALDPSFAAEADREVLALATAGGLLYVGGRFHTLAGAPRDGFGAVDATTGAIDPGFDPRVSRSVYALDAQGDAVYAGGNFASVDGSARSGLALVDPGTGRPNPGFAPSIPVRGVVGVGRGRVIVVDDRSGAANVVRLRALDARTGRLLPSFRPPDLPRATDVAVAEDGVCATLGRTVRCYDRRGRRRMAVRAHGGGEFNDVPLAPPIVSGSTVFVSGVFTRVGGLRRRDLAAVDVRNGRPVQRFRASVRDARLGLLAAAGGRLYLSGSHGIVVLDARSGRLIRRFRALRGNNAVVSRGRLWLFNAVTVEVASLRTGAVLGRVDVTSGSYDQFYGVATVIGSRAFVGGPFGDPDLTGQGSPLYPDLSNTARPFLTAYDVVP